MYIMCSIVVSKPYTCIFTEMFAAHSYYYSYDLKPLHNIGKTKK